VDNHFLLSLGRGLRVCCRHKVKAGCSLVVSAGTKLGKGLGEAVSPVAGSGERWCFVRLIPR